MNEERFLRPPSLPVGVKRLGQRLRSALSGGRGKVAPVYLVLGMHRSGTSAATQLLALSGCGLPLDLVPADDHNARGYFEPWRVAVFNGERLRASGGAWDDPFGFPFRPLADDDAWARRADELLRGQFDLGSSPLLKDPRLSLLMPLWRPLFEKAGLTPMVVIPVRHPLEVARSLQTRDGFVTEKSVLLWCAYMLAAEAYSRGLPRVFVSYEALLEDWRPQAARIEAAHGRKLPALDDLAANRIDEFLTRDLRHHQEAPDPAKLPFPQVTGPILQWLQAAARDEKPGYRAINEATTAYLALAKSMGPLVSPLTRDLDQTRADLLYTRQLLELERADLRAQIEALKADAG